jgi:hypothetical protein
MVKDETEISLGIRLWFISFKLRIRSEMERWQRTRGEIEALERSLRFHPSHLDRERAGLHRIGSALPIKSLMIWYGVLGSNLKYPVIIVGVTKHSFGARVATFLTIEFNSHMHYHKHCYHFMGCYSIGPVIYKSNFLFFNHVILQILWKLLNASLTNHHTPSPSLPLSPTILLLLTRNLFLRKLVSNLVS